MNTYSKITVWECMICNVAIMRRVKDGWVNATHIMKLAGYGEKAKRTKLLEKMVHIGVHEKVQGGFGRYQGTWTPVEDAIKMAQEFGVAEILKPLFDCQVPVSEEEPGEDGAAIAVEI
ncbi:transcription regulator HTH, apses-type DNA-binding domain-containing protein [Obelidium mucronatum]|nr:transcription regulator HTH, apses-type DNA-binding domain-containing protein [Obelidium mucronatum]